MKRFALFVVMFLVPVLVVVGLLTLVLFVRGMDYPDSWIKVERYDVTFSVKESQHPAFVELVRQFAAQHGMRPYDDRSGLPLFSGWRSVDISFSARDGAQMTVTSERRDSDFKVSFFNGYDNGVAQKLKTEFDLSVQAAFPK